MPDSIHLNPGQRVQPESPKTQQPKNGSTNFTDVLSRVEQVRFSNHAQKRMESRSIDLTGSHLERLNSAVDKAKAHGGKESLILMDDLAFIVNVQQGLVVTTLDVNQRSEGVFTQIDSVVIAQPDEKIGETAGNQA